MDLHNLIPGLAFLIIGIILLIIRKQLVTHILKFQMGEVKPVHSLMAKIIIYIIGIGFIAGGISVIIRSLINL